MLAKPASLVRESESHCKASRTFVKNIKYLQLTAGIALGRVGTPEDVASIVRYLAVEAHMFMTGQHFVVDGFQWNC